MVRLVVLLLLAAVVTPLSADELTREELQFFESKIRPVLIRECYGCHSNKAGNARGGLRLDSRELMRIGGSTGPAVVPGDLENSWLYNAITHQDYVMPPKRKLSDSVIADFRKWIEMGAPDPRVTERGTIKSRITKQDIEESRESFWAYQRPEPPTVPSVEQTNWPRTAIDRFILARLEDEGMGPADDAEAWKVARRLYFDLVGLPPSPQQIRKFQDAWKADPQQAITAVVDELLASDQFGERWGRHWLDVVRYAESTGREVNMTYPHAWRYRDYVIDSFNADKPFDRFVQEQIAGDLLPVKTDEQWAQNLVATTFLAIGPKNLNEQNRVQFAADLVDEQIDATTRVFLGTSVACARCHDHKFDPIPQTDYYALAGVFGNMKTYYGNPQSEYGSFNGVQEKQSSTLLMLPVDDPNPFDRSYNSQEVSALQGQLREKLGEMSQLRRNRRSTDGDDARNAQRARFRLLSELAGLSGKLASVDESGQPRSFCMGVQDLGDPRDSTLLVRGEIDQPAQSVERGFPQVLCSDAVAISDQTSGRLELARWIGSDRNSLTARVMVNRVWQNMIGQGIVTSTENFGSTGQPPSHPELLDYLAVRFVESGWSVKSLVRDIATSRVYRVQTTYDEQAHAADPDNALLWRANPRRLDAEAIRDAMLSVSGQLDSARPRASIVAQAGYQRVRNGQLGTARSMMARTQPGQMGGRTRDGSRAQFGGRSPFGGQSQFGGRPQAGGGRSQFGGRPEAGGRSQFGGRQGQEGGRGGQGRGMQRPGSRPGTFQRGGGRGNFQRRGGAQGSAEQNAARMAAFRDAARRAANPLDMEAATFRSVYLPIVRDEEPRSLEVFDFADSSAITGQRETSNTANQALYMMNNHFVIQQSEAFAQRIAERYSQPAEQIHAAFVLAWGRPPTPGEKAATVSFLRDFVPATAATGRRQTTLSVFCQSLFAAAEFRYID